ncbi:uncharacterized protein PG986_009805 [Apiospora aurea]|uniref:Uncharacterized protein n=1 Tax=Apiospora aurea TaxID=335848 RepID=A0ABR1Q8R3_9PEZI
MTTAAYSEEDAQLPSSHMAAWQRPCMLVMLNWNRTPNTETARRELLAYAEKCHSLFSHNYRRQTLLDVWGNPEKRPVQHRAAGDGMAANPDPGSASGDGIH